MNTLTQNIRYALRQLRKSPAFTLTVIITLALGIGANAAVFTLFDQVLLRMLPVEKPKELVRFEWTGAFSGSFRRSSPPVSARVIWASAWRCSCGSSIPQRRRAKSRCGSARRRKPHARR